MRPLPLQTCCPADRLSGCRPIRLHGGSRWPVPHLERRSAAYRVDLPPQGVLASPPAWPVSPGEIGQIIPRRVLIQARLRFPSVSRSCLLSILVRFHRQQPDPTTPLPSRLRSV